MSSVVATAAERWAATVSTSRRRIAPQKPSRTSRGARMAEWLAEWLAGWLAGGLPLANSLNARSSVVFPFAFGFSLML